MNNFDKVTEKLRTRVTKIEVEISACNRIANRVSQLNVLIKDTESGKPINVSVGVGQCSIEPADPYYKAIKETFLNVLRQKRHDSLEEFKRKFSKHFEGA